MSVSIEPRIGEELAGYRIERLLSRGETGAVYLAEDTRLQRSVALKLAAPDLAADERFRERFLREGELAASVDHPSVVSVHGAGETDGRLWIATRFVEGDDLASVIGREGPLEPARALELCSQIAGALDAARAQGLARRPLEPTDVVVATEGELERCYVRGFQLDEQATAEADLRSLAGILYRCLTGNPAGEGPPSVWVERPDLPQAIDDALAEAHTYGSCSAFCDAARKALGLAVPWWRSRRALVIAAVLVAIALATGLGLWLTRAEDDPVAADAAAFVPLGPGSLVRIDAETGEIVARVPVMYPKLLASDGRSIWSLSDAGTMRQKLVRVEVATNSVTGAFGEDAGGVWPTVLAVVGGSVWLGNESGSPVYRLAPGASAAEPVVFENENLSSTPLAAAAGSIWAPGFPPGGCCLGPPDLYRIDPATGRVIARIDGAERIVAAGPGFVWALGGTRALVRIDPETNTSDPIGTLAFRPADFTVADGIVWASSPKHDTIVRLDPTTGEEYGRIRVGRFPRALAAGPGAVWVALRKDGTVARYDIADDRVKTIDVGGTPNDLVVVGDSVWVAVDER